MRILTVINVGYPVVGGLQITHQAYMDLLAKQYGHDCGYLDSSLTRRRSKTEGTLRQDSFRDMAELRHKITGYRPDVLIAGFTLIHDSVRIGTQLGVPVIGWLNSYEYCPPSAGEIADWGLTQTHRYPNRQEIRFALENADHVVTNSHYMRRRLQKQSGIDSTVIYPPFSADIVQRGLGQGEYVAGICGFPHKGVDIFLTVARAFPDQKFLQIGPVHADYFNRFQSLPNVTIMPFSPLPELLQRAKIILVPSQWPEPFGRIAVEAMANGIPTLASRYAGLGEIVGSGVQGVDEYTDEGAWIEALGSILYDDAGREANAQSGRKIAAQFLGNEPIRQLNELVHALPRKKPARETTVVQLTGDQKAASAFSLVNSRLKQKLEGGYTVFAAEGIESFIPDIPDVVIHHDLSQEFSKLTLPPAGHFVAYRTWDFGRFPANWVTFINENCDQLWVYSHWTKKQAALSGIPKRRVKVIPLGFNEDIFKPDGRRQELASDKSFKFLFAGATVLRKGIDVLLKAYSQAFSNEDDVCLVIKDNRRDVFYEGERWRSKINELQAQPDAAEILYLDEYFSRPEMAALYRSTNVGVFPYRAEGFALPILEAMACRTPSIVPRFGACLDYVSKETSFLVPARRINLPVFGEFAFNTLGFKEEIDEVDFCEVSPDILAAEMRRVYEQWQRDGGREIDGKARRGAEKARTRFTWQHTQEKMHQALQQLDQVRTPLRFRRQRQENERQKKVFAAARDLFLASRVGNGLPVRKI